MDKTTTRNLPVKLTDEELAERSQSLAEAEFKRVDASTNLEDAAETWKETKKRLENSEAAAMAECVRLSRVVKYREEPREVECAVVVANGQYSVVRKDTGEVVATRAATNDELQMTLADAAGDAVDEAVKDAIAAHDEPWPSTDEELPEEDPPQSER